MECENIQAIKETLEDMLEALESLEVEKPSAMNETTNTQASMDFQKVDISTEELEIDLAENLSKEENNEHLLDPIKETEELEDAKLVQSSNRFYYNWNNPPRLLCEAIEEYQPTESYENFTKGCHWSPDGTCLLVPSEDFRIRVYELPRELYCEKIPLNLSSTKLSAALTAKEGGLIYDTCWYPFMNSWEPATCCFLSTSKESPIHLWDAFNGELRATYRAYNQVDEVEASISIQFIDSAKEVWAGFKNALRVFDMERPGRQINTIQFKNDFPNITGLVSCIRENPIMPGLVAFGTYSKYIGVYKDGPLCSFKTGNGVTQIEFSPCGTKLFSTVRRNSEFLCWDLRNPGTVLFSLQGRQSDTNQRIQFNIMPDGKSIVSGGTNGEMLVWEIPDDLNCEDINVAYKINLSRDCINGVSLHRSLPIVALSTGQRFCDSTIQTRDNSVRLWLFS
ncbi:telomerase Cajal body protein 1 [Ceratina calcarata]|uniref:WD repeat-containing protein 79 n=1 Tax=Ceratina calcarata TaxID=156304 RepID=A0AAJ7ITQ0_9HYME|nr:telomerase Cajal body protein 1 [Ceratina calcarata]